MSSFTGDLQVSGRLYEIEVKDDQIISIMPKSITAASGLIQPGKGEEEGEGQAIALKPPDDEIEIDEVFRHQVFSVLTDNRYDRRLPKRKRGKLDTKGLWRVPTGVSNVFSQKQARKGKRYSVVLLVDESGSMQGDKIKQASRLAMFLAKHFDGSVDLCIIGFNCYYGIHKDFGEDLPEDSKLMGVMRKNASHPDFGASGNNDLHALSLAFKHLSKQPGQKLLVMLSDGEPATIVQGQDRPDDEMDRSYVSCEDKAIPLAHSDSASRINSLVKSYQRQGIKAFGIGIRSDCWQIPQHQNIEDVNELKPVVLNWLRTAIKRGE